MDRLLNSKVFYPLMILIGTPILMIIVLAFFYGQNALSQFSIDGFKELTQKSRINELMTIALRASIVSVISTSVGFVLSYLLLIYTNKKFQKLFLILVTIPFLINEAIRIVSWRYILSENGVINQILSFICGAPISIFDANNNSNIYVLMVIACLPFAVFINTAALSLMPQIYWRVAEDLKLNSTNKLVKVILPLSKLPVWITITINFFLAFSLSSEVNFLGGDTKLSITNFTTNLMGASKFQSVFSAGFLVLLFMSAAFAFFNYYSKRK